MFSIPRSFVFSLFILFSNLGLGLGFQPPPLFSCVRGSISESLLKKWAIVIWEANVKTPRGSDQEHSARASAFNCLRVPLDFNSVLNDTLGFETLGIRFSQ